MSSSGGNTLRREMLKLAGIFMVSLILLSCDIQLGQIRARTILPAEEAHAVELLPDGRHILHGASVLDMATGEDEHVPDVSGMEWIGDGLFYGSSGHVEVDERIKYVINWPSLSAVRLQELSEDKLPARIQEANLFYVFGSSTESGKYQLFILDTNPAGQVVQGYHIDGIEDPERWLGDRPYQTPAPPIECDWKQPVPSPNGRYYYDYVRGSSLQIYTQEGKLVNSISTSGLRCYGWAWDSSGVFVQERQLNVRYSYIGPLLLLEAEQ